MKNVLNTSQNAVIDVAEYSFAYADGLLCWCSCSNNSHQGGMPYYFASMVNVNIPVCMYGSSHHQHDQIFVFPVHNK